MIERLGGGDERQGFGGGVAERTAGSRQDQARDLPAIARAQALVSAVVLAIDGHQLGAVLADGIHHDLPAGDEHFLIGQTHALPVDHRLVGGLQSRHPDNRRNDGIHLRGDRNPNPRGIARKQLRPLRAREPQIS